MRGAGGVENRGLSRHLPRGGVARIALAFAAMLTAAMGSACGRLHFADRAARDASVDTRSEPAPPDGPRDAPPSDAPPQGQCIGAWQTPTLIPALASTGFDDDTSFTGDLRELYYVSTRAGGSGGPDLWRSTRDSAADPWGAPTNVAELNTGSGENTPHISRDGLTLWFVRTVGGDEDILVSTRETRDDTWGVATPVDELNSTADDKGPSAYNGSLRIMFTSDRAGGEGGHDIYRARRDSLASPWTDVERLATISTEHAELRPWPIENGLRVYFNSDRGALSGTDFYVAEFSPVMLEYGEAVSLDALNSDDYDEDLAVSDDECYAVFASQRDGNSELYEATRLP